MRALIRPLTRFYFRLWQPVYRRRYDRLVLETLDGVPLLMLPGVFNGVLLRTGAFLARILTALPLAASGDVSVLDLGTGSGLGAVFAARRGFRVVGVDINPEAVRCARINVLLNQVEDRVEIRPGDLFAPVAGERFDFVLFNPPFYRGIPRNNLDYAWRGVDTFERFAAGLPAALKPGGRALIVLSSDGNGEEMLAALRAYACALEVVARRDLGNEVLTVYSVGCDEDHSL